MAYANYPSYTTTGNKASVQLDASIAPFAATVGVDVGGGATYKLQYSLDPIDVSDASSTWYDDATMAAGSNTSKTTYYVFPVTKVRLVIAAITDTIKLKVIQGFTVN